MGPGEDDEDDLPATQPVFSMIMQGVVAYVEVRSEHDNRSRGVQAQLRNLGATIAQTLTKEVTHVVFNEGLPSTYKKAKRLKCHLVSVLWIEACKDALGIVSEAGYPPINMQMYEDAESLKNFKKFKSMQPDFEDNRGEERIGKILKRIKRQRPADSTSCHKTARQRVLKRSRKMDLGSGSLPVRQLLQIEDHSLAQPKNKSRNKKSSPEVKRKTALKQQEDHVDTEVIKTDHQESSKTSSVQGEGSRSTHHVNKNVVITISDDSDNIETATVPSTSASVSTNQKCVRQRKKQTCSPMSRNDFVTRLSEFVLRFKQEKPVRPSWIPPKQKTQELPPKDCTDIPQRSGRHGEKQSQSTKMRSIVNPVSTVQERMPCTSASAALFKRNKAPFPLPSSPKDDFCLLSQEPTDVSMSLVLSGEGKGARKYLNVGEEKINYSEIVRAYDAYAKKVSKGAEQIKTTTEQVLCEIQDSNEELNEVPVQPHSQDHVLRRSQSSSPDVLDIIDGFKSHHVDDVETKTKSSDCASVYSKSEDDSSMVAHVSSTPRLLSELSDPALSISSSDVGNVALSSNPFSQEKSPVETQGNRNIINDSTGTRDGLEERSSSPVFVISRPKFRRRLNTNACTSVQHEFIPNVKEEFQSKVDNIPHSTNNCTQYLNKTLLTLQPKLRLLSSSDVDEEHFGEVLVKDTPEVLCISQKRRLQDGAKITIPPTPEEKLASSQLTDLTDEQNQSVTTGSVPGKSLRKPLFASRTQKKMLPCIAEDSAPSPTRTKNVSSACELDTEEGSNCSNENSIKNEKSDPPHKSENNHFDIANKMRSHVRRSSRISTILCVKQENYSESDSSVSVATEHTKQLKQAPKQKLQCSSEDDCKPGKIGTSSQGSVQFSNHGCSMKRSTRSLVKRSDDDENKLCLNESQRSKTIGKCSSLHSGQKIPSSSMSASHIKKISIKVEDTSGYETLEEVKKSLPAVPRKLRNRKLSGEAVCEPLPKRQRSDKSQSQNAVEDVPHKSNLKKKSDAYNESVLVTESNKARQGSSSSNRSKKSMGRVKHVRKMTNIHAKMKEEFADQNKKMPNRIKQEEQVRCSPRRQLNLSCPEQKNVSLDTTISNVSSRSARTCTEKMKSPEVRMTRSFSKETTPSIVCTFLNSSEQKVVENAVKSLGQMQVEEKVSAQTTHVITTGPKRTMNMLKGLARGCWLLHLNWVLQSINKGRWLPEEPYEMTEFSPAVKECRKRRQLLGPAYQHTLFATSGPIFVSPQTKGPPAKELYELLELCGAELVTSWQKANIVIGTNVLKKRDVRCVDPVWVLNCVTHNKLLPL